METEHISQVLISPEVLESVRKCYSWTSFWAFGRENTFLVDAGKPNRIGKTIPTNYEERRMVLERSRRYSPDQDEYLQVFHDFSQAKIEEHLKEYEAIHGQKPNTDDMLFLTRWNIVGRHITEDIPETEDFHPYAHRVLLSIFDYTDLCELTRRYPKAILITGSVEKRNHHLVNLVILKQKFQNIDRDPAFFRQSLKMDMLGIAGRQQELVDSYPEFARERVEEAVGYKRVYGMLDLKNRTILLDPT